MPSHISLFILYLFSQFIFRAHSSYLLCRCRRQLVFFIPSFSLRLTHSLCMYVCRWLCLWFNFGIFRPRNCISSFVCSVAERRKQQHYIIVRVYSILKYHKSKGMTQSFLFRHKHCCWAMVAKKKNKQTNLEMRKINTLPNRMESNFMKTCWCLA